MCLSYLPVVRFVDVWVTAVDSDVGPGPEVCGGPQALVCGRVPDLQPNKIKPDAHCHQRPANRT